MQGACRFGLYEYFKKVYSNVLVDQNKSLIFFVSSASAEVIANVALCPFEAIKVRVQAQPHFAKGLIDGFPKAYMSEGIRGYGTFELHTCSLLLPHYLSDANLPNLHMFSFSFNFSLYRGLIPLWGRNLPCNFPFWHYLYL